MILTYIENPLDRKKIRRVFLYPLTFVRATGRAAMHVWLPGNCSRGQILRYGVFDAAALPRAALMVLTRAMEVYLLSAE